MKLPLPKRINALIKLHGTPLMVISKDQLTREYNRFRRLHELAGLDPIADGREVLTMIEPLAGADDVDEKQAEEN